MPKQQKTYTREFKLEAVQLVKSSGKPMSQIARDLGVSETALYHWCKQLAEQGEQAFPSSGCCHRTWWIILVPSANPLRAGFFVNG
jgi:transposase